MAEKYIISGETLSAIADSLRVLSGTTDKMTPDAMVATGEAAEAEMQEQAALITKIQAALEGKVIGDGEGESSGDPDLPSGYYRVDYIRFTGDQSVDTGIVGTQDTKVKCIFTRETDSAVYLYGVANTGNTASITAYLSSAGNWRFGAKTAARTLTVSEELWHTSIQSKTGVDAISPVSTYSGVSDFTAVGSLIIGAGRNPDGSITSESYVGKMALFEMRSGDAEGLHLIPVTNGSTYRFYDKVSKTFFDSFTDTPLEGGNL